MNIILNDDFRFAAANFLYKNLNNTHAAIMSSDDGWPQNVTDQTLWLVGHGNGRQFEEYKDPHQMLRENSKLEDAYKSASHIWLVSCDTARESHLIERSGFQAQTFAVNLKQIDTSKTIHAVVGPVYAMVSVLSPI